MAVVVFFHPHSGYILSICIIRIIPVSHLCIFIYKKSLHTSEYWHEEGMGPFHSSYMLKSTPGSWYLTMILEQSDDWTQISCCTYEPCVLLYSTVWIYRIMPRLAHSKSNCWKGPLLVFRATWELTAFITNPKEM